MEVGSPAGSQDDVFVLVVDADTLANMGQAQTNAAQTYSFALPEVVPGAYLLVAGTDRDNDGFIGDEGNCSVSGRAPTRRWCCRSTPDRAPSGGSTSRCRTRA